MREPLDHLPDTNYYHYALQLNIYRFILEEYGMHVSGLFLGIFHPSYSEPLCVQIPRLDQEMALLSACREGEREKKDRAISAQVIKMSVIMRIATAAQVERDHVQRVFQALIEVLKEDLKDKKKVRIPGLLCASASVIKEKPQREKVVFGKILKLPPKPSRKTVRLAPCKNLRELN